jgi:hypothetical protein
MNNDLIKEFARQSGFKVNWQHEDVQAIKMAQYKEFAELVIRECDRYVAEHYDECEPWMEPGDLLKHFGVDE